METDFNELMTPTDSEYWVLDGTSRSYDLREEIKSWGGWWESTHKNWCISTNGEDKMLGTTADLVVVRDNDSSKESIEDTIKYLLDNLGIKITMEAIK